MIRPTYGYLDAFAAVPDGERWPVVHYRVCGLRLSRDPVSALLRNDGTWWHLPEDARKNAFIVPPECSLTQAQLSDAMAAARIVSVLPIAQPDRFMHGAPIVYDNRELRPALAREEWKPRAPRWRGGKSWV